MRVGIFTYGIHGQRMTGIARYAVELTRALRRLAPEVDITLLHPYPDDPHPWYREFPTYPLPALRALPAAATLGSALLDRAARRLDLDVLHDPCGIAPFLWTRGRHRRIVTVHDAVPYVYPATQPLATRLVFQTLVRAARWTSDAVLTVSDASARDLQRHAGIPGRKIHVTPLGVTPAPRLAPEVVAEALERHDVRGAYFLAVGALHPRKNLAGVVAAHAALRAAGRDTRLVVVGPPSWGEEASGRRLRGQAEAAGGVRFTGFVSDADLAALYAGARALVFPSLYEGFGLPVLEAMAHGTPVITSDRSSLPEVAGDAALLVDPRDVAAIAAAMGRLVDDEALRARLVARGRERSGTFSWSRTARRTLDAYEATARA